MLSSDFQKLSVKGVITLYELDATRLGAGILRWHGHVSFDDWNIIDPDLQLTESNIRRDIIWQGQVYNPVPIESEGLEMRGDGKASSPRLRIASDLNGVRGLTRLLCLQYDDFAGADLTVIRTSVKHLDAANFVNGNPSASSDQVKPQKLIVEKKIGDNETSVTFELSTPVNFEGNRIPTREITSFCHWGVHGRYRGSECKYMGTARFTEDGKPTDDPELDKCGARLVDCDIRDNVKNFGGFPSSSLMV